MENDSIETLLCRHYGNTARTPIALQKRLIISVRSKAEESRTQQILATRLAQKRLSRRHVVRLVAKGTGTAGLGLLSLGLESLQKLETTLLGQEATQTAYP